MASNTVYRVRGNNFTKEEELNLLRIIKDYKNIIENKQTGHITPRQKEVAWISILKEFNSCNTLRTMNQIKSKYDNLKTASRKYFANCKSDMYGTGGGPAIQTGCSSSQIIYEEVADIINTKTVYGLNNSYDDDNVNEPVNTAKEMSENVPTEDITIVFDMEENNENTPNINETHSQPVWISYSSRMLKEPKHKKSTVKNKPAPQVKENKTFYALKQRYIEQKILNLKNNETRKQERHEKEMELLNVEIEKKRRLQ